MIMSSLAKVFAAPTVKDLAGSRSYRRGRSYYRDGRVEPSGGSGPGLRARVRGTMPYTVKLWADGGKPGWSCTCPAAEDGSFCKHCVAVALSLDSDPGEPSVASLVSAPDPPSVPAPEQELADFVGQLSQARLAEMILKQSESDWRLRERLLAEARAVRGEAPDMGAWRRRFDKAFAPYRGFVSYREAEGWAAGIDKVIDALEDLYDSGHPDSVALLAEHAHRCADQAVGYVDDSDGWLSVISERLSDLHCRACSDGRPEPADLAARLVKLELDSGFDGFYQAAASYAEILGEAGLAAYREHLERRRTQIEAGSSNNPSVDYSLTKVHTAMVGWAHGVGDPDTLIDTLVEVRSRTRIHPGDVMDIIRALTGADREDEAIEWARRGLREYQGSYGYTADVREYLAGNLRECGDSSAAVGLYWDAFTSDPSVSTYRRLLQEAGGESYAGDGWSLKCVEELHARLADQAVETDWRGRRIVQPAAKALVEILLYEGRIDEAWSAATDFGCNQQMWLTLARAREQAHPLDAIDIYEPEVLSLIDRTKTVAYKSAVELMDRIRRLADAANEPDRFTDLLERIRVEHRFKRNLKALLDDKGW